MIALLPFFLSLLSPVQAEPVPLAGTVWRNPRDSVHVRFDPCGTQLCGTVIWASDKAIADAARGSKTPLVGTSIFRNFHVDAPNVWRGKVYVPDLGQNFSGRITRQGDQMIGRGCILAGLVCKSQTWSRVR